jgi:sulfotransferase
MIEKYKQYAERIKRLTVYEDDTWIVTFPKCGTTWAQEMIWLVNNDLDYATARQVNLNDRYPFLE